MAWEEAEEACQVPTVAMFMYTSAINSCLDRLNTKGDRESASQLMLGDLPSLRYTSSIRTMHDN